MISSEATQSITAAARVIGPLTTCCEIARVLAALCEYMDEDDRAIMAFELNRLAGALLQQRQLH